MTLDILLLLHDICFLAIVIWRVSYSIEIWIHPHTKHIHFVVISLETIFLIVAEQNDGQLSVFGYQTSQSDAENDDRQANRQKITVGILFLKMVTSWKKASNLGVCVAQYTQHDLTGLSISKTKSIFMTGDHIFGSQSVGTITIRGYSLSQRD